MLKNKIYKYFASEIFKSFLTILFALTAVAWTVRAVSFLDLIVENGHSISTYLLFSLYNITNIVTKFIPLSFLLALVLSLLKFEKNSELIILWTNGLNKIKVANLFFLISLLILFLQLTFAVIITPSTLNESRRLVKVSGFDSMSSIIKVNDFSDSFKNLTFYVEERDDSGLMKNIFIRDEGSVFYVDGSVEEGENANTTIIAKSGIIQNKKLILTDGLMQSQSNSKKLNNVSFNKT
jgi:lipopolysaccharide export system permease protein